MAGAISWAISFTGAEKSIAQLKTIDTLLNSISRKGGMFGGGAGGINIGGQGGTTFIGGVPSGTGRGSNAASTAAAAAGAAVGSGNSRTPRENLHSANEMLEKGLFEVRNNPTRMAKLQRNIKVMEGTIGYVEALAAGWETMKSGGKTGAITAAAKEAFRKAREEYEYSGPTAPGGYPVGSGIIRTLSNGLTEHIQGLSRGLRGGIGKIAGGDMAGGWAALKPVIGQIIAAFLILRKVTELLAEGIKHGAEAYQQGARHGSGVGTAFQLKSAFAAIGMGGGEENAMLAMGQFNPKAKKMTLPGGEVIGMMRAGQFAGAQQLTNMSKEFEVAMKDAASSARQMEESAKATQRLSMQTSAIGREWHTLWTQIAKDSQVYIGSILFLVKSGLQLANKWAEMMGKIGEFLHILPKDSTNFSQMGGAMGKSGPSFTR